MVIWQRPDLVRQLSLKVDWKTVQTLRAEADKQLEIEKYQRMAQAIEPLPTADQLGGELFTDLNGDHVAVGKRGDLNDSQFELLKKAVEQMHPWRKGPFRLFDYEIDAEWRSNLKWDRIVPALGELRGRKILDLGCGNGYYMFRAAAQEPNAVLGMDPSVQFYYMFELMQRYLRLENLQYERLGLQHLHLFDQTFDIAMCMGILYHHRSPIDILKDLRQTIRVGGFAIIECQTIPGSGTTALFPADRYAKARNVYFVPTADCLINWVRRAGFKDVELVCHTQVTSEEQRRTPFMQFESLADFLDPKDSDRTIEGYPGPYRTVVKAFRKHV